MQQQQVSTVDVPRDAARSAADGGRPRWQAALGIGIVLALMLALGAAFHLGQRRSEAAVDRLLNSDNKMADLSLRSSLALYKARDAEGELLLSAQRLGIAEASARALPPLQQHLRDMRAYLRGLRSTSNEPQFRDELDRVEAQAWQYEHGLLAFIAQHGEEGRLGAAQGARQSYLDAAAAAASSVEALHGAANRRALQTRSEVEDAARSTRWSGIAMAALAALLGLAALLRRRAPAHGERQLETTPEPDAASRDQLASAEALRTALERDEFYLVYQPQFEMGSDRVRGVEALIRWRHPQRGLVSPAQFIPLAEQTGLIVPIGEWALRTACFQNRAWQDAGLPAFSVSVNVSARQFREPALVERVARALEQSGLEARYLELELTESLVVEDPEKALAAMQALQAMDVQFAIDDFGIGHSSLSTLKRFPIARLKIDQAFVRDLPDDEQDQAIVRAIISLGHALDLKVIAEGVETLQQQEFLRANGCDETQGYLLSPPVSAAELAALVACRAGASALPAFGIGSGIPGEGARAADEANIDNARRQAGVAAVRDQR